MTQENFTFQDICMKNDHHWDNAYAVLTYHLEHGNLEKVVRGPEDIIYRNIHGMEDNHLEYDRLFLTPSAPSTSSNPARPKRRRIGAEKVEIPRGE
ncbi:hypothetical protein SYJ56_25475 [Algoriphagus sp. D3-2-R+10]|uniref:hypothetical protein n=1 Tax=Algoriphagus aurantiacus TaxID=3103948 RepID=UPI002B38382A|nr:hypothetical protein [Algoriphagus sp. D3-2-R+10]MEB2778684.1 hypothetical protein [Algoriphagus sp. D3-2-R+10]